MGVGVGTVAWASVKVLLGEVRVTDAAVGVVAGEGADPDHARGRERVAGLLLIELREVRDRELEIRVRASIGEIDVAGVIGQQRAETGADVSACRIGIAWATS